MEKEVRLFASVDLIGSTAYKGKFEDNPKNYPAGRPAWFREVGEFYKNFQKQLEISGHEWEFVKGIGDEAIFSKAIKSHTEAYKLCIAYRDALNDFNEQDNKLKVKGTLWIAGFPINNTKIHIHTSGGKVTDYLGPSIDTGFRISKYSTKRKLAISVDLALLISHKQKNNRLKFYFDGTESLKGVLNNTPYPIIWIEVEDEATEDTLIGIEKKPAKAGDLFPYCQRYIDEQKNKSWLIPPYFEDKKSPFKEEVDWHSKVHLEWEAADEKLEPGSEKGQDGSLKISTNNKSMKSLLKEI